MTEMIDHSILSLGLKGLENLLKSKQQPKYRAKQIWQWIVQRKVFDFNEMTNLPQDLRIELANNYTCLPAKVDSVYRSSEDGTVKYVSRFADDNLVETVVLQYHHGNSVCVSSQVGCAMGCEFCASTQGGLVRNCSAADMLAQVLLAEKLIGDRVSNVVIMGVGEPLHNYDNVIKFIKLCQDSDIGLGISMRNVTISTCGMVPKIYQLAEEGLPVTLAISLHAANDQLRKKMMPIAQQYSLDEVLAAADTYFERTGRRVTYEYILIKDINDSLVHAKQLAHLLRGRNVHVNLIPLNKIEHKNWQPATKQQLNKFLEALQALGLSVTVRRELGSDIDAACGQLRSKLT